MRMTVEVPDDAFEEMKRLSGRETLQEIVVLALEEFVRRQRLEGLRARIGKGNFDLTQDDLEQMREDD